jgi:hypothetical protein
MFEIDGVSEDVAREACALPMKLPVKPVSFSVSANKAGDQRDESARRRAMTPDQLRRAW